MSLTTQAKQASQLATLDAQHRAIRRAYKSDQDIIDNHREHVLRTLHVLRTAYKKAILAAMDDLKELDVTGRTNFRGDRALEHAAEYYLRTSWHFIASNPHDKS